MTRFPSLLKTLTGQRRGARVGDDPRHRLRGEDLARMALAGFEADYEASADAARASAITVLAGKAERVAREVETLRGALADLRADMERADRRARK